MMARQSASLSALRRMIAGICVHGASGD